jgi:hypothetical protein
LTATKFAKWTLECGPLFSGRTMKPRRGCSTGPKLDDRVCAKSLDDRVCVLKDREYNIFLSMNLEYLSMNLEYNAIDSLSVIEVAFGNSIPFS